MRHRHRLTAAFVLALAAACASAPHKGRAVEMPKPTHPLGDLERDLGSPDAEARARAAWEISGADRVSRSTAELLLELARHDTDSGVRNAAAWAFGHLALQSPGSEELVKEFYDQAPRLLTQPRLVYPADAFQAKVQGTVEVDLLVDEQGRVAKAEVRTSIKGLDQAALDNCRGWMFEPARKNGQAVATTARAPVTFSIY